MLQILSTDECKKATGKGKSIMNLFRYLFG